MQEKPAYRVVSERPEPEVRDHLFEAVYARNVAIPGIFIVWLAISLLVKRIKLALWRARWDKRRKLLARNHGRLSGTRALSSGKSSPRRNP